MIMELIPTELHADCQAFRQILKKFATTKVTICPYCGKKDLQALMGKHRCRHCHRYSTPATHTPFNRLTTLAWLETIFVESINRQNYRTIADKLGCSIEQVMRRHQALLVYMQQHYANLYAWYIHRKQTTATTLSTLRAQHQIVNAHLTQLSTIDKPTCVHCGSTDTVKQDIRMGFRCKTCRRHFTLISNTPLNHLSHSPLWLTFVDLLVQGCANQRISKTLQINKNTVAKWRRAFRSMMKKWQCHALAAVVACGSEWGCWTSLP